MSIWINKGMTVITAIELAGNYPANILINASKQDNGKFSSFCYMTRDGIIHKLMLSTQAVFDTEKEAKDALIDVAISCKKQYGE